MNFSKTLLVLISFICYTSSFSKNNNESENKINLYLVDKKIDSLKLLLDSLNDQDYLSTLNRILENPHYSYAAYTKVIKRIIKDNQIPESKLYYYLSKTIKQPEQTDSIDIDYVILESEIINFLSEGVLMKEAEREHNTLKKYISQFSEEDPNYKKAQFYLSIHQIIVHIIQENVKEGEELCLENLKIAQTLNDTDLIIYAQYLYSFILVYKNELDNYIQLTRSALKLDEGRNKKSDVYYGNLSHLIDAYIYKGVPTDSLYNLILLLHSSNEKYLSYSYFIQLLTKTNPTDSIHRKILDFFNVKNIESLIDTLKPEAEQHLSKNDYDYFLRYSSYLLAQNKLYDKALKLKDEEIRVNQELYSKNLAKALANNKINQVEFEAQQKIKAEEEQKKYLYKLIFTSITFIIIIVIFIIILYLKNKKLSKKSLQILEQKEEIDKKNKKIELLLKEIHHRVKNNFQVVMSLIDLQTQNIKDKNALNLASESKQRIKAMAAVHQKLLSSKDQQINAKEYISELIKEIQNVYTKTPVSLSVKIPENLFLDIDTAIPLSLIINELTTNYFKYAYSSQEDSGISIEIKDENTHYTLIFKNKKSTEDKINSNHTSSTSKGMGLIKSLTKQLHGNVTISEENDYVITITFKDFKQRNITD